MIMPQPDAHETKPFFGAVSMAHYILYSHIVLRSLWIIKINPNQSCWFSQICLVQLQIVPHIFVWGSLCTPACLLLLLLLPTLPSHTTCSHTTCKHTHTTGSHTHNIFTHNLLTHNLLTHNLLPHNMLTHNLSTHNLLTHTQLAYTQHIHTHNLHTHTQLADTQLTYTQLVHTHTTYSHTTCPHTTCSHTTCSHTTCSHTTCFHTTCSHTTCPRTTCSHTTCSHTQLAHTQHIHTHNLHTHTTCWHTTYLHTTCPHTHNIFTHNLSTHHLLTHNLLTHNIFTNAHNLSTHNPRPHTQLAHTHKSLTHSMLTRNVPTHTQTHTHTQLGYIQSHLVWQAWHLVTSTLRLRGRHGTYGTGLALVTRLVRAGRRWRRGLLRGMRGTWRHPGPFGGKCGTWWHRPCVCVAGMALMALGWLLVRAGPRWRRGLLCGRRGTWRPPKAFGVAALGDIDLAFAWQAWHLLHWAGSCDALGPRWSPVTPPSLSHSVFTFFWWLIGRSWHVGLSGPLIYVFLDTLTLEFKRPYKRRPLYRGPILK